jgi:hypothetical protein
MFIKKVNLFMFYIFSIAFIWSEIYYVLNKSRMDKPYVKNRVGNHDEYISDVRLLDILCTLMKILFVIWVPLGIFLSSNSSLFIFLTGLNLLIFPFFHFSKRLYVIWKNLLPVVNIIFMLIILFYGFFR